MATARTPETASTGIDLELFVDALGGSLLQVELAPRGLAAPVRDVVVHDADEIDSLATDRLVVVVGTLDGRALSELIGTLAGRGCAALCTRLAEPLDDRSRTAAEDAGLAVLSVPPGVAWTELIAALRALLTIRVFAAHDGVAGSGGTDLFSIADTVARAVGAPITIEDELSRVIAFSADQDGTDVSRRDTILGRRVPERYLRLMLEQRVFDRLSRSDGPFYVELAGIGARVAVAVRADGELVGSMWAAVDGPLGDDQMALFGEAAQMAAVYLLRDRAAARGARRAHANVLRLLLLGRGGGGDAAARLGLLGRRVRVVALAPRPGVAAPSLERIWDGLALHLSSFRLPNAIATSGDYLYAAVGMDPRGRPGDCRIGAIVEDFIRRGGEGRLQAGIGEPCNPALDLARSRGEADQALRVVLAHPDRGPVAEVAEVRPLSLLLRFMDLLGSQDVDSAALRRLAAHDAQHQTDYLATLRAHLDCFGDTAATAKSLHVHPNTVRYRMRKLQEISRLRLDEPAERLGVGLLLAGIDHQALIDGSA